MKKEFFLVVAVAFLMVGAIYGALTISPKNLLPDQNMVEDVVGTEPGDENLDDVVLLTIGSSIIL